jgi:hypothetical protein
LLQVIIVCNSFFTTYEQFFSKTFRITARTSYIWWDDGYVRFVPDKMVSWIFIVLVYCNNNPHKTCRSTWTQIILIPCQSVCSLTPLFCSLSRDFYSFILHAQRRNNKYLFYSLWFGLQQLRPGEETTNTYFIVFDLVYSNVETGRRNNKYLFYSLWFGLQQCWKQEKKQQIPIL